MDIERRGDGIKVKERGHRLKGMEMREDKRRKNETSGDEGKGKESKQEKTMGKEK